MIQDSYSSRDWSFLISLVERLSKQKVGPTTPKGVPLNYQPMYAEALFNLGKQTYEENKYKIAGKNFSQFIQLFKKDRRRPEALYLMSYSFLLENQTDAGIKGFQELVTKYPSSKHTSDAIITGGEYSVKKNYGKIAIFFYQQYLKLYPKDKKVVQIREILAKILIKEQLYGEAARLYQAQSRSKLADRQTQIKAALAYIEVVEKHGDIDQALPGAKRIRQIGRKDHHAFATALGLEARFAYRGKNLGKIRSLEKELEKLDVKLPAVQQSLGETRYYIARLTFVPIVNREHNLTIKDPQAAVLKYYENFQNNRKSFDKVCSSGISTYCAPSKLALSNYSLTAIEAMEQVSVNTGLDDGSINNFKLFRNQYLAELASLGKNLEESAKDLADKGTTTKIWKQQIFSNTKEPSRFEKYINGI